MTIQQIVVDAHPYQEQIFKFAGMTIRLTLRYLPTPDVWEADLYDEDQAKQIITGLQLVTGIPLLERKNLPFFLWLTDESDLKIDPAGGEDIGGRCLLYIVSKDDNTVWTQI